MKQPKNTFQFYALSLMIVSLLVGLMMSFQPITNQQEKKLVADILQNLELTNAAFRWDVNNVRNDFEEISKFRPSIKYDDFMDSATIFCIKQQKKIANLPVHDLDSLTEFFQLIDSTHHRWLWSLRENNPFIINEMNMILSSLSSSYIDSFLVVAVHDSKFRKQLLKNKLWRNNLQFHSYLSSKVTSCGGYDTHYFMPTLSNNIMFLGYTLKTDILLLQERRRRYIYTMNGELRESFLNIPTTINITPPTKGKQEIPIVIKIIPPYFRGFNKEIDTITIQENITYYAE